MSPGLESSFPPSGYGSGHGARRDHKRPGTSLFQHANHTFVSKPPDPPPPAGAPLFSAGRSVTSFTFSAGSPSGTAINNPFASSNEPHPPAPPTFNFTRPQGSRDVSGSSSGSSSGSASFTTSSPSESTESLSSGMASLKIGYLPRRKSPDSSQDKVSSDPGLGCDDDPLRDAHLRLLGQRLDLDEISEIQMTPLFTEPVRRYALSLASASKEKPFSQYGLLAGDLSGGTGEGPSDPRIFWNIAAPSSVFICGSQGSGKSHTLSCLLENALAPCKANVLPRPLTGIVFHYDTFISDSGGSPCEVAWLSSNPDIKVRVLCPPTNIRTIQRIYKRFPRIEVEELRLNESDLNTKRMLDLMAVTAGGSLPLYLHVAQRILRDMRIVQQQTGRSFSYSDFKQRLQEENLTEAQLAPLKQRLETLESFMVEAQAKAYDMFSSSNLQRGAAKPANPGNPGPSTKGGAKGTSWTPQSRLLTIVDLSCPCVTPEMACSLFHICLSLFLEQDSAAVGRLVALDEAHKYMTDSDECHALTEALLATIRLQRHLGARVVVSTQEPTVSPKLLDLCSVTVVHRFTSPDWLGALKRHLAGVSTGGALLEKVARLKGGEDGDGDEEVDGAGALALGTADPALELFSRIVDLRVGEALVFAPSAIVSVRKRKQGDARGVGSDVRRLAHGVLKVRIRNRTTEDGGRSIMAA